jgi:hypothetical protein
MRPIQGLMWGCALALLAASAGTAAADWGCAPQCPTACCCEPCPPRRGPIRRFLYKVFHPCCPRPAPCAPVSCPAPVVAPFVPGAPVPPPPPLPTANSVTVPPAPLAPPPPAPVPAAPAGAGSSYRLPRLTPPVPPPPVPLDRIASSPAAPAPAFLAGWERAGR